jgi:hypothetical protein
MQQSCCGNGRQDHVDLRKNGTGYCPALRPDHATLWGAAMSVWHEPTQQEIEWAIERMEAPLIDVDPDELMELDEHERTEIEIANFMMTNRSL